MASGRKKRMADAVAQKVLVPAGLTNYLPADLGVLTSQLKLLPTALYESGAISPSFVEGSTTVLSNAVSNVDGNWSLFPYTGETGAGSFFASNTVHRYLPYPGAVAASLTDSVPVVLYSKDGPQGYYNPAYLPTAAQVNGSGSIAFGNEITGAAGSQTKLRAWIAGAVPTGTIGSIVQFFSGSNGSAGTAFLTFSASATPIMQSGSFTYDATTILTVVHSSSANTKNLNVFKNGVVIYISGSST